MGEGLKTFTADQWDWLLTMMADCKALEEDCEVCVYEDVCNTLEYPHNCPVCHCFSDSIEARRCRACMPDESEPLPCLKHGGGMVDALIERLYREGIFEA